MVQNEALVITAAPWNGSDPLPPAARLEVQPGEVPVLEHYRERPDGVFGPPRAPSHRFRFAGESRIIEDLRTAARSRADSILFEGPLLNPTPQHARLLGQCYEVVFGSASSIPRIPFGELVPRGVLGVLFARLLRQVEQLQVEFQSAHPKTAPLYRTRYEDSEYELFLRRLKRYGIHPSLVVTVGIPGEDADVLLETLRRAYHLEPREVRVRVCTAEPGTFFHEHREAYGIRHEPVPPYRILESATIQDWYLRWLVGIAQRSTASYNRWAHEVRRGSTSQP